MEIKISVIVPVYNVEHYLEKCILSILSQTYQNYELILLNDGSTDKSYDILLKYCDNPRVIVINKENTGQSDTRYQGLNQATGDYVFFVDSDDYIEPYALERLVTCVATYDADVVFGRYRLVDEKGEVLRVQKNYSVKQLKGLDVILSDALLVSNFKASLCIKLMRKKILTSAYTDDVRDIHFNEDMLLSIIMASYCKNVVFIDDIIYNVLQREGSVSRSIKGNMLIENDKIYKIVKKRLLEIGLWEKFKSEYYNGYVKAMMYSMGLIAVRSTSFNDFKGIYSMLDLKHLYYSDDLKKNISSLKISYRLIYVLSKNSILFYSIIKIFKFLLKY